MKEITATSGQLIIYDNWLEGNLVGTFTIYGTLSGTTLTITKVNLKVAHGSTNYQTTNSYVYYLTINGWQISATVKATTGSNAKVNFNGTIWTGTKTFTLTPGTSSLPCDSRIYISNGRNYYNTGVKSINLGVVVSFPYNIKLNSVWENSDIYLKKNNTWTKPTYVYYKINGVWKIST